MSQIERDLTYRNDSLEFICEQYGEASEECRMSTEIWETQHSANVLLANVASVTGGILLALVLGAVVLASFSRAHKRSV